MELKRVFISLDLSRECINEIKRIQLLLKKKNLFVGKFTDPEHVHLTFKFLGEIDEKIVGKVKERLKEIKIKEFNAELGEIGIFSKKIIRIIWIKLNGKVFELQKEIDEKLSDLFKIEERFMSHITIARVKHIRDKKAFIEYIRSMKPKKIRFPIRNFYLMESELKPEGPIYREIEKYKLEKI